MVTQETIVTEANARSGDIENKSHSGALAGSFDAFMEAFETFKATNDQRLREIERRSSPDIVTTEKLDRITRAMDENRRAIDGLALKGARPPIGGRRSVEAPEHRAAFDGYVRRGIAPAAHAMDAKALSVGSDADGGYLVPSETETAINTALRDVSPIRAIAGVRQISTSVLRVPFATSGAEAGWTAETSARPQTAAPILAELSFPTMELYAMPAATQTLLDDAAVDIDMWLAEEVRAAFAEQEGITFVTGDGVGKPKGFLAYPQVADASWAWGSIGTIASGAAGGFAATDPQDRLIDLVYALRASYRANGTFVMNRSTQAAVRKLKDADGHYIWQPASGPGQLPSLLGFPVVESEDMPEIAANAPAIAFGDFRRGYLIVDRVGIRVLRDPYSSKPYVLFYTTKRVGGGVQDFEAIKLMTFSA